MTSPFIDIHTHQNRETCDDIVELLNVTINDVEKCTYPYKSAGIHPWEIEPTTIKQQESLLIKLLENGQINAIGECGLDGHKKENYHYQIPLFELQLSLAEEFQVPVIIHAVKTYHTLLQLRKKYSSAPWIIHGFNADVEMAKKFIQKKVFLSFGVGLFQSKKQQKTVESIALSSLFLETDTSTISISKLYTLLSEIKGVSIAIIKHSITQNFRTLFCP